LGNHPTTLLALELALTHVDVASLVFDLGSGSGVLAVALGKLRNCSVQAYDIAESSRDALAANAARNGVATCSWSDGYPNITVDVVLANILAPVLIQESSEISSAVKNGGLVILSGMRTEQVEKVCEAFPVLTEQDRSERDGWTAVVLRKES
ncbi:MAG: 50S ribosomal protein L11 methyltransferase, partial [Acidimicrobiaceae bacterium]